MIRLSKKYGVNPTIPVCFWCGKEKGEVALLGELKGEDREAPMYSVIDYEPCERCRELFAQGVQVIAVTEESPDGRPSIVYGEKLYPTGAYCVIKREAMKQIIPSALLDEVLRKGKVCMPEEIVKGLLEVKG